MSGHSKWSTIKHKKAATDAKRGALFTKFANAITVAAKSGDADPDMNFALRLAIDKAKKISMPKDNIDRAIARANGTGEGGQLEEITYEGFGPAQTPVIIEVLTDNKNRSAADVKQILTKSGGSLAGPGAVAWQFEKKGVINVNTKISEDIELELIDYGLDSVESDDESSTIYCPIDKLQNLQEFLQSKKIEIEQAGIEYVAKEKKEMTDELSEKMEKFIDALEESEDITNYYTNLE